MPQSLEHAAITLLHVLVKIESDACLLAMLAPAIVYNLSQYHCSRECMDPLDKVTPLTCHCRFDKFLAHCSSMQVSHRLSTFNALGCGFVWSRAFVTT
eukprot:1853846-Amphidinium_carterae.1